MRIPRTATSLRLVQLKKHMCSKKDPAWLKINKIIFKKKKPGKQIPVKARICAKPRWLSPDEMMGVNKADLTAFRSDLGISCIRLAYLAVDLGKSDPIPQLLVPLHLSFNPAPFCLQTEAHEAPP